MPCCMDVHKEMFVTLHPKCHVHTFSGMLGKVGRFNIKNWSMQTSQGVAWSAQHGCHLRHSDCPPRLAGCKQTRTIGQQFYTSLWSSMEWTVISRPGSHPTGDSDPVQRCADSGTGPEQQSTASDQIIQSFIALSGSWSSMIHIKHCEDLSDLIPPVAAANSASLGEGFQYAWSRVQGPFLACKQPCASVAM